MDKHNNELAYTQGERVLIFLYEYSQEHIYYPTCREIARAIGRSSTSAAHYYIQRLEAKGFVQRAFGVSRGAVLTKAGLKEVFRLLNLNVCPHCGQAMPKAEETFIEKLEARFALVPA